jgi:hypothetical protein
MRSGLRKVALSLACGAAAALAGAANAAVPIMVDPDGPGPLPPALTGSLDWQPGNVLIQWGNPGQLQVGQTVRALMQARLAVLLDPNNVPLPFPPDKEWTYVASVPLKVVAFAEDPASGMTVILWEFDDNASASPGYTNFVEIWQDDVRDSNDLSGTGFNNGRLILTGIVTGVSQVLTKMPTVELLDQFQGDNYSGKLTLSMNGSQQIRVNVTWPDGAYFPDFTPDKVDSIVSQFNASSITPFRQANPSAVFLGSGAGTPPQEPGPAPTVVPNLGTVNGQKVPGQTLDIQAQADPNQSFEFTQGEVPGACRVTYGGNDVNGNVNPRKFAEACYKDPSVKGKGSAENCYTFGGQAGAPSATAAKGGPFGEHTHHQKYGPAGEFIFRAGTNSAPKSTRIQEIACKDEGACRQAAANGNFKQIDFDGTGSFRMLNATAKAYLEARQPAGAPPILPDNVSDRVFYFRVDMDDLGEPGNQWASGKKNVVNDLLQRCQNFFSADQNNPLASGDPLFLSYFGGYTAAQACSSCPDVYQIRIYSGDSRDNPGNLLYEVRGFLTGGNIQIHRLIR